MALSGQPPFRGENLLSLAEAIRSSDPSPLTGDASSASNVLSRSLSKDAGRRYQTVGELLAELTARTTSSGPTADPEEIPSIAVLPFDNMSADPEQEYFCEGMAEEIINALAALDGLRVASRTSAFQAKARDFEMAEIGTRLNVGTALEGSVRKAGNRLRVTAQLINVSDGYHLWSERYDREVDDVFAVQDEITRAVVNQLKVKLLGEEHVPVVRRPTDNLHAYSLFLKCRHHVGEMTGAALKTALDCGRQALALEPAFGQAHAGLAQAYVLQAELGFAAPHTVMPVAKDAARRALSLDDTIGEAHGALAEILHFFEWDWVGAEREYRRALELNPGDTRARSRYAELLGQLARTDESIAEARAAVERDPLSSFNRVILSLMFLLARDTDAVISESRAGLALDPGFTHHYNALGQGLGVAGRYAEAADAFRQAADGAPGDAFFLGLLGWASGLAGRSTGGVGDCYRPRAPTARRVHQRLRVGTRVVGPG